MAQNLRRSSLAQLATEQLAALAAAGGMPHELPRMRSIVTRLLGSSAARTEPEPAYASDVVDDHSPYELSFTIGGAPEVRLLVEPVEGSDTSLAGRWRAARAAGEWLRGEHGAELARLDRVADLFEPKTEHGLLALWYAIVFRPDAPLEVKAYVDLRSRGAALATAVLEEALARLGLASAYPELMREACHRGTTSDELVYLSLDLATHDRARVKVYLRHHRATSDDLERVIGGRGGIQPEEVHGFCRAMLGSTGPYVARPPVTCWSFSTSAQPSGATLYLPIAYYAHDDEEAHDRIHRWLAGAGLDADRYSRLATAFARRPLGAGVGMHSYVSFKRDGGKPKLTAYVAPEAYQIFEPGSLAKRPVPPPKRPQVAADMVRWFEGVECCTDHPLFRRLAREPVAIAPLWTILANNWVGIGDHFPRWLAGLVARVGDDRVRSILAKQLDDELGHGVPDQAHRLLFQRMLADLEPYAPKGDRDALLAPGRRLREGMAHNYLQKPELEAIGGTLIAEIYGKQVDQAIGSLFRRQTELDTAKLTWLVMHETLEEDHANESLDLAGMTPASVEAQAAVCRGAEELAALGNRYFDDIYQVVFPS